LERKKILDNTEGWEKIKSRVQEKQRRKKRGVGGERE
jgi:hypothetical protein